MCANIVILIGKEKIVGLFTMFLHFAHENENRIEPG
jgi:hypothetical protein